jgi:hypothetical protein
MHVPDVRAVEVDLDLLGMQRVLSAGGGSGGGDAQPAVIENDAGAERASAPSAPRTL